MLHQERVQLFLLGDHEIDRLVKLLARKVHRAHQSVGGGCDVQVVVVSADRGDMELPRLTTIDQPQGLFIGLDIGQIDLADKSDVLFDPGVFDRTGFDAV